MWPLSYVDFWTGRDLGGNVNRGQDRSTGRDNSQYPYRRRATMTRYRLLVAMVDTAYLGSTPWRLPSIVTSGLSDSRPQVRLLMFWWATNAKNSVRLINQTRFINMDSYVIVWSCRLHHAAPLVSYVRQLWGILANLISSRASHKGISELNSRSRKVELK